MLRAVVQAPIVEEVAKGLGLLLIFVTARRAFDGPVDGVVYGALIGAGFAFTENIQYFAISLHRGRRGRPHHHVLRPRHPLARSRTSCSRASRASRSGLAARRGAGCGGALGPWLLGTAPAPMLLHAFWNGSAVFGDFFQLYMTLQMPLFVVFILGVLALRREEARLTAQPARRLRRRRLVHAAGGRDAGDPRGAPRAALAWARTLAGRPHAPP